MKTTNLGNVAVQDIGVKRSNIPINRNVFTSCGFGEVQPLQVLQVDADTETTFSVEDLTFVEPIVAPVYGHCSVKYWHYFVAMRDLFEDFDALLAETRVRKVGGLFVPKKVPHAPRNLISTLLLWGAKCTLYRYTVNSTGQKTYYTPRPTNTTELTACSTTVNNWLSALNTTYKPSYMDASLKVIPNNTGTGPRNFNNPVNYLGIDTGWLDARLLVNFDTMSADFRYETGTMRIPIGNASVASMMDMSAMPDWLGYLGLPRETVVVGKHDYLIEKPRIDNGVIKNDGWALAFKLSAFGRRMLKVFKGAEFQESWTDDTIQSLIPFFAVYKAYFDCFGLLQYDNFESTSCKRLLNHYEQWCGHRLGGDFSIGFFDGGVANSDGNSWIPYQVFQEFIKDLGSLWVTDSQDVQSAHAISPNTARNDTRDPIYMYLRYGFFGEGGAGTTAIQVPNVDNEYIKNQADNGATPDAFKGSSQQAYIDRVEHSHLDSELLKTMYLCTNLQTIAGQRVKQLLQMLGFGDWMEHQKPRFIGYDEQAIEFNQVQAKADTLKDGTGMALGERAGVGESYKFHKQHKFTNNEMGFIISLMAVVPDSGYVNTMNVAFGCVEKYDFFQAAFDGMGMELNKIANVIVGAEPNAVSDPTLNKPLSITKESFGYAPTATKFKFVNNIFNGKFAQQSVMDNYTPYSMDRVIKLGELAVISSVDGTHDSQPTFDVTTQLVFDPMKTPRAGLVWRYPTRYPWFGQLTRIFAAIGDFVNDGDKIGVFNMLMNGYEYFNQESDGFVMLQTIRGQEWTHKLPITDSFETREDGNSGKIDTNVSKA